MKNFFYLSLIALLFSCSTKNEENSIIKVSLPAEGTNFVSWFDVFPNMEMVCLSGENKPMFHIFSYLIIRDGIYYVVDLNQTRKVHRFNKEGKYLNSIGTFGRGPGEYLDMTDVMVDDKGNVSIHSRDLGTVFTYAPDGTFLESKELPYATERFMSHNGFHYHYVGTASYQYEGSAANPGDYRLYITDSQGQTVGKYLPSPAAPAVPNLLTFSLNGNDLYLCPTEGNDIYQLDKDKMKTKYSFDFGAYNMTQDYYACTNLGDLATFLKDKTIVTKFEFWENNNCAVFEGMRQTGIQAFNPFCGILDREKNSWKWYNFKLDDFILLRLLDGDYAYFIADPEMMKQVPALVERFPKLKTLTINDGMVLIKAKTKDIK